MAVDTWSVGSGELCYRLMMKPSSWNVVLCVPVRAAVRSVCLWAEFVVNCVCVLV